jgi:hypothetical protein
MPQQPGPWRAAPLRLLLGLLLMLRLTVLVLH